MGAFDRFRNLEKRRPERDGGPDKTAEGVAERFGQPDMPPDPAEAAPIRCLKCGGENPARSNGCFNCGADLDTAEVRANQVAERANWAESQKRAAVMREAKKKEAEAYAERALAKLREDQQKRVQGSPAEEATNEAWGTVPLFWLLRLTRQVSDPWLRLGVQVALVGGIVGLVIYALGDPSRLGFLIVVGILLGGGGYSRYGRWRRRDWWW
jgi:hypothetical protein